MIRRDASSQGCVSDDDGEDSADGDGNDGGEQPPESAILLTMEFTGFPRVQVQLCTATQVLRAWGRS